MYDQYAQFYDMMTDRHIEDLALYEKLVVEKPSPYLEVGCGTGRVLSHLLSSKRRQSEKLSFLGVDVSDEMLGICKEKNAQYINTGILKVKNHDFALNRLPGGEQFNAAFITFFTLNYVPEKLHANFLANIRDALNPGGIVTIDCFYPYLKWHPEKAAETFESEHMATDGKRIKVQSKSEMITSTLEQRTLIFTQPDGRVQHISSSRTYVSPEKGKTLLQASGFTDIRRLHNYQLPGSNDFAEGTQGYNFVLMAKK